ncbi:MAG TPA: hypothetical protein PK177_11340 [Burkholderiaceae bacterium]|nr:hypothetical protein [Burkholderiaceae bacterium]
MKEQKASAGEPGIPPVVAAGASMLPETEAVSVDKIRDLLFGNQMQDYDRRFATLEERFLQRLRDVETEGTRNLGVFEANSKKQIESVAAQLREEKDARADAEKEIERTLRETIQSLEKRVRQLSDQLAQLERELGDRVTQESQGLREELKRRNDDTRSVFDRTIAELGGAKTDRKLLAGLFAELAKCLSQDTGAQARGNGSDPVRPWQAG